MSGRLVGRFLPVAVVKKDGLASRVNRNDANRAILRVGDIEVICGSTFSKILFVRQSANMLGKRLGEARVAEASRPGNNGVVFCLVIRLSRRFSTPTA